MIRISVIFALTVAVTLLVSGAPVAAAPGDIATLAGGGVGDGGPLAAAALAPYGLATDASGATYIADAENCRVRRINGGVVSTIGGSRVCGYAGDGGPATSARFDEPQAVAVAPGGDVFVADTNNCRIRKISGGTVTTVAGAGLCTFGGDGGLATSAQLAYPAGVAVSASGDLYIADTQNCRIRKVTAGIITTIAGSASCGSGGDGGMATLASLSDPRGVAVSGSVVHIADTGNCRVRSVSIGVISTIAGTATCAFSGDGGFSHLASLNAPSAVAVDASGVIYLADTANCRIRAITVGIIGTVAGSAACGNTGDGGSATSATLSAPGGIAVTGTTLLVADTGNCRMRTVTSGTISATAGTGFCRFGGDAGAATNATLNDPAGVVAIPGGGAYVADTANCRIRLVNAAGSISTAAGTGVCGYAGDGAGAPLARLSRPESVVLDAADSLFIADTQNCRVRKITAGIISTVAGTGVCGTSGDGGAATAAMIDQPSSVAFDALGALYIAEPPACRIRKVAAGVITTIAGGPGCGFSGDAGAATLARLNLPRGVAVASSGDVYIADTNNCRVRRVSGGVMTTVAGDGVCAFSGEGGAPELARLATPVAISIDLAGAIYISTEGDCRVRRVQAGIIVTIAGDGFCGDAGDGGPATAAQLGRPAGIGVNGCGGAVYVAARGNNRVRVVAGGFADADCDAITDTSDNCPAAANPSQANADRNFTDLSPPKSYDDLTRMNSDALGDACDTDDDNDGLTDSAESSPPCLSASGATNPLVDDTDGDRVIDGAECLLGYDPASAASRPPAIVAPDADSDGVPDAFDPNDAAGDSDADGVQDRVEFRYYGGNLSSNNTDGDSCNDAREVASINADQMVNAIDLSQVASVFGPSTSGVYLVGLDPNRDGNINAIDLSFVAQRFGPCP